MKMAPSPPPPTRATARNFKSRPRYARLTKLHMKYQENITGESEANHRRKDKYMFKHRSGKSKGAAAQAAPAANDVQATALPDPIPVDAASKNSVLRTTLTVTPTFSIAAVQVANTAGTSQVSDSAEYSLNGRSTTTVWVPASQSISSYTGLPAPSDSVHTSSSSTSSRLPVYGVILLAVGATGLALAAVLVLRCFLRRHIHVDRPRPSAPILQESPLFGGKERFSRGIWSDPSFNNLLSSHTRNGMADGWRPLSGGKQANSEKMQNKRKSVSVMANLTANDLMPPPLSPASVYTTLAPPRTVGVAMEFPVPPKTMKSATQPLKVKDKGTEGRTVRRRSVATLMYDGVDISSPTLTETETAIAYQAPRPAPTPRKPKSALKPSSSSREHVQRPARKNVPSQASQSSLYRSTSASRAVRGREKEEPFMYTLPSVKSQERRDRDTKALTSALGLSSPPPPSSCFSPVSIYPDDSLSVAHGRGYGRSSEVPSSEMPSPTGTHAALGDLMLQDFPSTATFASLRTGDPFADEPVEKKSEKGRVNDRPPRVPSPPPLPSLAQMALANSDPDYRSPTYSIYGLYEAQRKSKMSLGGN